MLRDDSAAAKAVIQFKVVLEDFADTMDALREFVASLGPVLVEREREISLSKLPMVRRFGAAMLLTGEKPEPPNLSEEEKATLLEAKKLLAELATLSLADSRKCAQPVKNVTEMFPIKFVGGKAEVDWGAPEALDILPAKRAIVALKKQLRLLHESALMALTCRGEWFIAQLLHLYFNKYPSAAGMSEPFFSLDTLASLQTIDDARSILIEHKVESLMRESFEDWLDFFRKIPKLGMGYLSNEIEKMSEIFKRRNLVVHNGGRAGRTYCKEVDEALRPGIKLGEVIEISPAYLNASIDLLEHQLLLLAAELWKNLEQADENRGSLLASLAVRRLEECRWATARGLSRFGMDDKQMPESIRLSSQINYWQSFKWAGQYEEIREEVEGADFSAKSPLFQLAYAAIRDDFEVCFKLLPGLLERDELGRFDLNSWPVFQALRKRPEFASYKSVNEMKGKSDGGGPGQAVN